MPLTEYVVVVVSDAYHVDADSPEEALTKTVKQDGLSRDQDFYVFPSEENQYTFGVIKRLTEKEARFP